LSKPFVFNSSIFGTLASANVDENLIKIRKDGLETYLDITVPSHLIQDIIKAYFGEVVEITAKKNSQGIFILEKIKRAA